MAQASKNDFIVAIAQICTERGLSKDTVLHAVEQALISAYKRNYGGSANISAKIDPNSGKVKIFAQKAVVDQVTDRRAEISLADARVIDPMADIGATVAIESTPDNFGRIAAQTAKQVVLQRIREAERDALYTTFHSRESEIVQGTSRPSNRAISRWIWAASKVCCPRTNRFLPNAIGTSKNSRADYRSEQSIARPASSIVAHASQHAAPSARNRSAGNF